jgi:hypothetical protein
MKSTSTAIVLSLAAALLIAIPGVGIAADPSGQSASWNDYGVKNINNANLGSGAGFVTPGTDTFTPPNAQVIPPATFPVEPPPQHPRWPLPPNRFRPPQIQNWPTPPDFGKPPSFGKPPMIPPIPPTPPLPPPGTQWDKPGGKPPGQGQFSPGHTDPEMMRFLYLLWLMQHQGERQAGPVR